MDFYEIYIQFRFRLMSIIDVGYRSIEVTGNRYRFSEIVGRDRCLLDLVISILQAAHP